MDSNPLRALLTTSLLVLCQLATEAASAASLASPGAVSSVDTLYAIPSLIGTEPGGVAWSRDSSKLAFLWNDSGGTFRDVWQYDPHSGKTHRLTHHDTAFDPGLEHRGIGEAQWLGTQFEYIAYTLDGQLHLGDASGSRKLDTGLTGIHQMAAAPDGLQLSFVARGKAATGEALWLLDFEGNKPGKIRLLFDPKNADSSVDSHHWSADSQQLAFKLIHRGDMARRDIHYYMDGKLQIDTVSRAFPGEPNLRFDVGIVDVRTGNSRLLEREDSSYPVWNYGLSADGRKLFINESDPYAKHHRIEMYELASGSRETFYQERDPRHLRPDWKAAWAPGDDGLIILTDRDGYLHLYHQKSAGSKPVQLTSGNWEIADFTVSTTTGELYFRANMSHQAERQLYRVPLNGGKAERVSGDAPGTHHVVYAPDMRGAATIYSNDFTPPDLYLVDFSGPATTRITRSPTEQFSDERWADVRYIQFNSHVDGAPLVGRLSLPRDFDRKKRYPLIVGSVYSDSVRNQWGGRTAHPTWGLDQHLVAQGYILLNVNIRGSWGQGREHNQGLLHSYGNIDIDDLHSGVIHLVEKGYADPERVGIWGSSYGGLMTMMSLFKKPEVYAVGIAGAPATNVWHAYPEQMWVMGPATGEDMPGRYEKQSPLFHTDGLRDPLMIIHGSRDEVVLYSDTIAVANKLIAREQDFDLVTLPGTGHGWDAETSDLRRFSFKKMVEFFNRHLQPGKE